jgi:tetratricopeptide (TPR) repeat protein
LVYSRQGEYEKALDDYNKVVELNPFNVYGYFNRGVDYFAMKRYKDAENDFTKALSIFPDFVGAYINRAAVRSKLGDNKGAYTDQMTAEAIIKKINGDDADMASLYNRYSDSSYFDKIMEFEADFMSGNMKRGRIQFNRVKIEPKPDFFIVNAFRLPDSVCNKYSKAEYFDENLTQFNTSNSFGIKLTFTTRQWPVSEEKAIDELQKLDSSILIIGDTAGAWFMKGVINSMLQNYSIAIDAYDKALKYNNDLLYAQFNRAASRVERDEFIYSDQQYQNAITISMTSGNSPAKKLPPPDHRQSLQDYDRVILLYPGLPFTYYNRANLKILLKNYQSAINDYSKAIELEPEMAEAYFNRALTLLYLREDKLACKDLSKAGELGFKESYNIIKRYCGK